MNGHDVDPTRIFVVGSPRSGTTLTQRLVAERFRLHPLPATHLVPCIRATGRVRRRLGWARRDALDAAGVVA